MIGGALFAQAVAHQFDPIGVVNRPGFVATWTGFVYVAFVMDVFARRIVGLVTASAMASALAASVLPRLTGVAPF